MDNDHATEKGDAPFLFHLDDGADDDKEFAFLIKAFQHSEEKKTVMRTNLCDLIDLFYSYAEAGMNE